MPPKKKGTTAAKKGGAKGKHILTLTILGAEEADEYQEVPV